MIEFINDWRAGVIPHMLSEDDPRGAVEQLNEQYAHGGGWRPMEGFTLNDDWTLTYEGDPPMKPVSVGVLHGAEMIVIYQHDFVAVVGEGKKFVVARMD